MPDVSRYRLVDAASGGASPRRRPLRRPAAGAPPSTASISPARPEYFGVR